MDGVVRVAHDIVYRLPDFHDGVVEELVVAAVGLPALVPLLGGTILLFLLLIVGVVEVLVQFGFVHRTVFGLGYRGYYGRHDNFMLFCC